MTEELTIKEDHIDQEISEEDPINIEEPLTGEKRKKFHFSIDFDNELLRGVIQENPYDYVGKDKTTAWSNVAVILDEQLGTSGLLPRTCRDRCERLLSYYERDHPFLKSPTDALGKNRERIGLLDRLTKLRKDSYTRLINNGNKVVASPARKVRSARNPRTSTSSEYSTLPTYQLAGTPLSDSGDNPEKSAQIVLNGVNAESLLNGQDGSGATIVMSKSRPLTLTSGMQIEGPYAIPYLNSSGSLDSQERSLVKELLDARRLEDTRRREEIELRREELEVQRMKLELERAQWEAERKDREDRMALEQQERKLLLEFMKRALDGQSGPRSGSPPTEE